jgi:UDP-3-O-[3-hydroxymyristoyl] glucosamine N-acyltransferase
MLGGMVGVAGHLVICDDVALTGRTAVFKSISRPGVYSGSLWADEAKHFHRNAARFNRLEDLARRVRRLEGASGATEGGKDHE